MAKNKKVPPMMHDQEEMDQMQKGKKKMPMKPGMDPKKGKGKKK